MPDIFLSYTREDQATAQRFAEAFAAQSFSVWWDTTLRSGDPYDQVTEEALTTAKAVVVLWSSKSVVSRWVRAEATLADRNRTLVPAMIERCQRPIMFELTQTADLSHWTGDSGDPAWRAFLTDVRRFVDAEATPQAATPPASPPVSPPGGPPGQHGRRPSIAVLPFINRSGVEADDVFADCMVEDLTAALSVSRKMKVIAASATAAYRQGARDLRQIGRELGVRYLLEGNVRRVAENLRVTAQLVEADEGDILWTRKFDRPLRELSALQEELVTEVAAHLGVEVHRAEMEHALAKAGDITAREATLRLHLYSTYGTRAGQQAAVAEGLRAIELDPNDAVAYSSLASVQGQLLHCGGRDDPDLVREITRNIERARALDPNHSEVLVGVAIALAWMRRPREALALVERAVVINPNSDSARFALGSILARLGRSEEALAELDANDRLAPSGTFTYFGSKWRSVAHLQAGRLDQALEEAERAHRLLPDGDSLIQTMLCLAKRRDWARARDALRRLRDVEPAASRGLVEHYVRDFYCGAEGLEDQVALARKMWDEMVAGEGGPA
jgi:TolB-like protein